MTRDNQQETQRISLEETELEQAFQQVTAEANREPEPGAESVPEDIQPEPADEATQEESKQKKIRIIALSCALVVLLAALGVGIFYYLDYTKDDGLIYSNVYALGMNLEGMTPEEAKAALHGATDGTYAKQNLTIQFPDSILVLSPSSTGVRLDVDALVEAAYSYGRTGNRWQNTQAKEAAKNTTMELNELEFLTLDRTFVEELLLQHAESVASSLTETEVSITGEVPELNRPYAEAMADSSVVHQVMTIQLGTPDRSLDTEALLDKILEAYSNNDFSPIQATYNVTEPKALDLDKLFEEFCVAPVDAVLDESDYTVTDEILGYGFEKEAMAELLKQAKPGSILEIPMTFLNASLTGDSINANLFQDVLASADTDHVYNPNRTTNLTLAARAMNGTIVAPGEVFSFNKTVGERTAEKGYKPAAIYSGGATVDDVGGGICQVASTLYYCALYADLEIMERTEHQFAVEYVPYGMDATIYWGALDFKFRNNTDYPIRIDASVSGGQVHVKLVGTDTKDYYVKMVYETTDGPHYGGIEYKEFAANNEKGYKDGEVIQTAYTGRTVKTYKIKYSKATDERLSSTYEATSTYDKRDKIIATIKTDPKPTEPKPTEPTPTEPKPTDPVPTEPTPTEPKPTEPAPTEPVPTEPIPTEPAPTEPAPTEPAPTEPAPTEPAPTEQAEPAEPTAPGESTEPGE